MARREDSAACPFLPENSVPTGMNLPRMNQSCLVALAALVTSMSLNAGPLRTLYGTSPGGDHTLYIIKWLKRYFC